MKNYSKGDQRSIVEAFIEVVEQKLSAKDEIINDLNKRNENLVKINSGLL